MEPHVVGELPQNVDDFRVQQSRWSKGFVQVARKLLMPILHSSLSGEAKFTTVIALGQQLVFPVLVVGIVGLVVSSIGHGGMPTFFRLLLWVWFVAALVILFGSTWGAYRRLKRGTLGRYLVTAFSVPAVIVYLAAANAGAIIGAAFGKKTEFTRTPKTGG
jgi:cellulose synthase/poly-beta-1,6-N-acetylglucosamine synthase-like glycosyltransferase